MKIRDVLRSGIAGLMHRASLTAPSRRARGLLSIATFHRVLPESERRAYPYPNLVVTPQELDALSAYFMEQYDCGPLATQHARHIRAERTERPLLAITFDDGQYDNFLNARPILASHGMKATFFIPVAAVKQRELLWHDRAGFAALALLNRGEDGRKQLRRMLNDLELTGDVIVASAGAVAQKLKGLKLEDRLRRVDALVAAAGNILEPEFSRMMTFEEIKEMSEEGHEIGSHSMSHCLMPECDDSGLAYELAESRSVLEARTGQTVESFCYPNGNSDARSAAAVAQAGYLRAVTTRSGSNQRGADVFQLRRFDMDTRPMRDSLGAVLPALVAYRLSGIRLTRT